MSTIKLVCMKSQPLMTVVKWKNNPGRWYSFISEPITKRMSYFFPLVGNGNIAMVETNKQPTKPKIKMPQTMFHLSSVRIVASTGFCWLTKSTTCHFLTHFVCCFKSSFCPMLSTVSMMTCDLQVIQSQLLYSSKMRASCLQVWAEGIDLLFSKFILENTSVY